MQTIDKTLNHTSNVVEIYTDGACSGNPGPGGYGIILFYQGKEKELSAGYRLTTNNRMELLAAIKGLESLNRPCKVKLYSDSKYLVDAINLGWVQKWKKAGWMRGKNAPAKNKDLWEKILALMQMHQIEWIWVKGHANHPYNNRCDKLAVAASKGDNLLLDSGFVES